MLLELHKIWLMLCICSAVLVNNKLIQGKHDGLKYTPYSTSICRTMDIRINNKCILELSYKHKTPLLATKIDQNLLLNITQNEKEEFIAEIHDCNPIRTEINCRLQLLKLLLRLQLIKNVIYHETAGSRYYLKLAISERSFYHSQYYNNTLDNQRFYNDYYKFKDKQLLRDFSHQIVKRQIEEHHEYKYMELAPLLDNELLIIHWMEEIPHGDIVAPANTDVIVLYVQLFMNGTLEQLEGSANINSQYDHLMKVIDPSSSKPGNYTIVVKKIYGKKEPIIIILAFDEFIPTTTTTTTPAPTKAPVGGKFASFSSSNKVQISLKLLLSMQILLLSIIEVIFKIFYKLSY